MAREADFKNESFGLSSVGGSSVSPARSALASAEERFDTLRPRPVAERAMYVEPFSMLEVSPMLPPPP